MYDFYLFLFRIDLPFNKSNNSHTAYLTFRSIFHKRAIYFSSIVKPRSKPFLEPTSTEGKTFCSRRPLMGLVTTTDTLRVRRATNCTWPPLYIFLFYIFIKVSRFSVIIVTLSVVHSKSHRTNVRFTIS